MLLKLLVHDLAHAQKLKIQQFANLTIVPQCLSTNPFCSRCLGAAVSKFILFPPHHFLEVSDQNSNPVSDLMCDIFFILLLNLHLLRDIQVIQYLYLREVTEENTSSYLIYGSKENLNI